MVLSEIVTLMIYAVSIVFLPEYFGEYTHEQKPYKSDVPYLQTWPLSPQFVLHGRSLLLSLSVLCHCTFTNLFVVECDPRLQVN